MNYGVPIHISQLKVGDVVRPIRGGLTRCEGEPAISYTGTDGELYRVPSTEGWRNPPIGGPQDYRTWYDTATVAGVTNDTVWFGRPYILSSDPGMLHQEVWCCSRQHGGLWYELL